MKGAFTARCLLVAALFIARPADAEPIVRDAPAAGAVIARKVGEEVRFVDVSNWRGVDLQQQLLSGDVLRTNATGQLAVLFSDRTQVRLGRNTSLLVKNMGGGGDTGLELQSGTIWARAERGGQGLTVDTPAAAAAIRGTDWTMTVDGSGKTALTVLEGLVELSNAQGSVRVAQGEGAVVSIGQAPQKIVIVAPKDREQMLFHLSLRDSFNWVPASPLDTAEMRTRRDRIERSDPTRRAGEDWLLLAEVEFSANGRVKALAALEQAEARGLSRSQQARADLLRALIAAQSNRYDEAAKLFRKASPHLDPERRTIADYGGYYARSLADPKRIEQPPRHAAGAIGVFAQAWTAGFLQDISAAITILANGEKRFPEESGLPAARAGFALLLDDREQAREAIARALSIDPQDTLALEVRANYRTVYDSDIKGAIADFRQAIEVSPGSTTAWNGLGLVLSTQGADKEAEAALMQSIALDPEDPVSHVNLALVYLEQGRMKEAKREIDIAMKEDPSFDIAYVARGRYYLQAGEMDKAMNDLLVGSTANPAYSQAQLLLAAGHYESGNRDAADQALDNADRLDPNDPVVSSFRTAVAIDDYDSVEAIRNAQEFLKRGRARGGHFGALSANQDAGSTLNNAFRLQGLDAWGQYYGDAVYDPFAGSSYLDQAIRGSTNPYTNAFSYGGNTTLNTQNSLTFSSFLQGLMFDPHMLSGRSRTANLLRRPFLEGSIGGGFIDQNGERGWNAEAEIQGYGNTPFPVSFYGNFTIDRTPESRDFNDFEGGFNTDIELKSGNGYITASPTPDDRIVAYFNSARTDSDLGFAALLDPNIFAGFYPQEIIDQLPNPLLFGVGRDRDDSFTNAGIGWSHTVAYQNVVNAALFFNESTSESTELGSVFGIPLQEDYNRLSQRSYIAAINHTFGDDDLTWRYGLEGGSIDVGNAVRSTDFLTPQILRASVSDTIRVARAYVDIIHEITPDLKWEAALFGHYAEGDSADVARLEPRVGASWTPATGHLLRLAYSREGLDLNLPTLSPIGLLGMQSNQRPLGVEGYADTAAARWDAEWTQDLFTAVDFQHQELHGISTALPVTADTLDLSEGRIDRAAINANVVLGYGFGLSATAARSWSENRDRSTAGHGEQLPFVPETAGQIALTWVNTANIKTTVAANYIGKRQGDAQASELDDYWTLDANLEWEPLDKRFAVEFAAYNLLDKPFEVAPSVPGWGRTYMGSLKVRF